MKNELKQKVDKLAAHLLGLAANQFENHGCNDLDEGVFNSWTNEDKQEFLRLANKWNRGDLEIDPEEIECMGDSLAMNICGYILDQSI